MRNRDIDNSEDIIDSRDVIARIEELESDQDADIISEDETAELAALKALAEEGENASSDWIHGATLIRDSYFEEYARELAEDFHGKAIREASWPFDCIDWGAAAEALMQDYTSVEFSGVTYYVL